jgi:hypothetical protein
VGLLVALCGYVILGNRELDRGTGAVQVTFQISNFTYNVLVCSKSPPKYNIAI